MRQLNIDKFEEWKHELHAGESVLLSGVLYTARDAVHKRLVAQIKNGLPLPITLNGVALYYAGPTPGKNGFAVGSCGPTTSSRMDRHTPLLMEQGLRMMIGKGERNGAVVKAIEQYDGIYFCAIGGAGALYASRIQSCEVIAFPELGCESLKKMTVKDLPVIVGIDTHGGNIFQGGRDI